MTVAARSQWCPGLFITSTPCRASQSRLGAYERLPIESAPSESLDTCASGEGVSALFEALSALHLAILNDIIEGVSALFEALSALERRKNTGYGKEGALAG